MLATTWWRAASQGDVDGLDRVLALESNEDWLHQNYYGYTALHLCVWGGHVTATAFLLGAGADPNDCVHKPSDVRVHGISPLHLATRDGHADVVRLLLAFGAAADERFLGRTPLQVASEYGYFEIVELLVRHGAAIDAQDMDGRSSLHSVAAWGYARVARLFLDHGASVHLFDAKGTSALFAAAKGGDATTTTLLRRTGARLHNVQSPTTLHRVFADALEGWILQCKDHDALLDLVGRLNDGGPLAALSVLVLNGFVLEALRLVLAVGLHPTHQTTFLSALAAWAADYDQPTLVQFCHDCGV
ncbi:hypothetical protein SPRG_02584 [Saprolegnia parasitica CBS 223.65]|uniref:Uncharacterized protein n=1 Tax=Saprolegnia parasitica (strain CBS 223.65) TaxID=695850 RepID=A0A067CQV3_SAPPC|nr:hypothetical protein SPRG_02584 [Saprolegnia parasitica CBS 223.65]KDO32893.1 hypothetical protein SPRG_02584 [Saprolegnia parasitica CBS 223.65]|eukprot:XP_012196543.1 hypothetical protein SPRG_02584 [Saprolegnia parasitica CBS 223.65]